MLIEISHVRVTILLPPQPDLNKIRFCLIIIAGHIVTKHGLVFSPAPPFGKMCKSSPPRYLKTSLRRYTRQILHLRGVQSECPSKYLTKYQNTNTLTGTAFLAPFRRTCICRIIKGKTLFIIIIIPPHSHIRRKEGH